MPALKTDHTPVSLSDTEARKAEALRALDMLRYLVECGDVSVFAWAGLNENNTARFGGTDDVTRSLNRAAMSGAIYTLLQRRTR